jgi:hypothetical protein
MNIDDVGDWIALILNLYIIVFGLAAAWVQFKNYRSCSDLEYSWIRLAYAILSLAWALIYVYVTLMMLLPALTWNDSALFGRVVFRPLVAITASIMYAAAKIRSKSVGPCK